MKYCSGCDEDLELSAFGKDKYRKDGLTSKCKKCRNKHNREYCKKNPEMKKKHNDLRVEWRKEYYATPENKLKLRNAHLKSNYNLTHDDYCVIIEKQNGVCKICEKFRLQQNKEYMAIDHCHKTGKVRGILCAWCNKALGAFNDNIEHLKNAIKYLEESKNEGT